MVATFSAERLAAELARRKAAPREIVVHDTVGSTSTDLAARLAAGAAEGTVVVAERQSAGRGRSGRSWHSPGAGSLYLSIAVGAPGGIDEQLTMVPLAAGVALVDALAEVGPGGEALRLKWPNDALLGDRKLAGILCEVPDPRRRPLVAVVGLGLNLGRDGFPDDLSASAVSLAERLGTVVAREPLAAGWIAGLERWCGRLAREGPPPLIAAWRARAEPFGRRVRVGELQGTTVDLNDRGYLIIQRDDGTRVEVAGGIVERIDP